MEKYNYSQLLKLYADRTVCVTANCHLVTDLVGGMPGTEEGVKTFVKYQMKPPTAEVDKIVTQILAHEIVGDTRITPPEGELDEQVSNSVNLIRRDEHGPWLGDWMIKACLKAAASRLGLFQAKIGTKGDMAEMGRVEAIECSKLGSNDRHIYLRDASGKKPAVTSLEFFRGKVSSPQGSKSIVNLAEVCPAGSRFAFKYRFYDGKLTSKDAAEVIACAMIIGLGSCKAFERGKFAVDEVTVEKSSKRREAAEKKAEAA